MHSIPLNIVADPYSMFLRLYGSAHPFFLDSSLPGSVESGFSYLGCNPARVIRPKSFDELRTQLAVMGRQGTCRGFWGGAVGFISYDGQMCFGVYPAVIVFDHRRRQWSVRAVKMADARHLAQWVIKRRVYIPHHRPFPSKVRFLSNFNSSQYIKAVEKARKHIYQGDIYQINLSRRVWVNVAQWNKYIDGAYLYGQLRALTPTPFGAYFHDGSQEILSTSPERFLKKIKKILEVKPMKGTRPRGESHTSDARQKKDLLMSRKEKAELLMVTDLERNDLGRVCEYGSVKVASLRDIETYASVFQATSTVRGTLKKDCDIFDALKATFPSGSVTGCPKIEAMRIVKQLERGPRGLYTGAFGYISATGDADFSVLIRTVFLTPKQISFHVGGGIVTDSKPADEYEETVVKAKAMAEAIEQSLRHKV